METVRAAGKEIGGGASSGGISGGNRLRVLFSGAVCAKSGLSGYGYAVGNFRMEHEPDGIVFILPAKKAWNGAAARAACTFRGRDDLSDCVCSGERTGGRDDPDGAVAALWNPGSFFFLAALVPQQAVLVPGYCMLLEWCLHKKAASGVWISLAVIGIGCAVEGYVNPFILKAVMRLFWG